MGRFGGRGKEPLLAAEARGREAAMADGRAGG